MAHVNVYGGLIYYVDGVITSIPLYHLILVRPRISALNLVAFEGYMQYASETNQTK